MKIKLKIPKGKSKKDSVKLIHGDCLNEMKYIKPESVNLILTDPPYGTTACKWDSIIPLEPMWFQLKRIIKPTGIIVMTASQPFTTILINSNLNMFKYEWIWIKDGSKAINFCHAKNSPLKMHESVCVFSNGKIVHMNNQSRMVYNPQNLTPYGKVVSGNNKGGRNNRLGMNRPSHVKQYIRKYTNYPTDILKFSSDRPQFHPTQKPVALMEYLIKTYTNKSELVLDFAMGSGTTGVACKHTNRNFVGIELDRSYFNLAKQRTRE